MRVNPLEDVLAVAGVSGSLAAPIDAGDRWGVQVEAVPEAAFHAVTEGVAYLTIPGQPTIRMMPGDIALLPRGSAHAFASDPDEPLVPFDRMSYARTRAPGDVLALGEGPSPTRVLCAFYSHNATTSVSLFSLLPEVVYVPASADHGAISATIALLDQESTRPGMSSSTIIDRLIDVLLIQVLRHWLQTSEFTEASWLHGMADSIVGPAMTALHAEPERDWTLPDLADVAKVSRATLARRFAATLGESPSAYLTKWRMDLAARQLRETDDRVYEIAARVGYQSEYAFSRAFSRAHGISPQRYRKEFRTAAD
jgi:AraC-like DNA-binding protein